jgi:trigger factor
VEEQIFQTIIDKNTITVPVTLVEHRIKTLIKRAQSVLERQGIVQPNDPQAEAALRDKVRPQAEKDVRLSYLLKAIAEQEKLEQVDSDFEDLKKKALAENKDQSEQVEKYFLEHRTTIRASLIEGKVIEFLKNNAKIKTVTE